MPLALRPTFPQDEKFLHDLLYENFFEKLHAHLWDPKIREPLIRMQINGQRSSYAAQYPTADNAVIVLDDKPIGRIIIDRGPQFHTLVDITIAKKHRRAGIGTILVKSICMEADLMRKPTRLHVDVANPARQLYLRLGFRMIEDLQINWLMERPVGAISQVGNP